MFYSRITLEYKGGEESISRYGIDYVWDDLRGEFKCLTLTLGQALLFIQEIKSMRPPGISEKAGEIIIPGHAKLMIGEKGK